MTFLRTFPNNFVSNHPKSTSTGIVLSIGVHLSHKEWTEMKSKKPLEALQLMLSSKFSSGNRQDVSTTSAGESSATSTENLLKELRTQVLEVNLFQAIEKNQMIAFQVKNLLQQLNNPSASESLIDFIVAFEPLLEQVTRDIEKKKRHAAIQECEVKLKTEVKNAVEASRSKLESLQAQSKADMEAIEECDTEIAKYQAEIKELQSKIQAAESKKSSLLRNLKTPEVLEAEVNEETTLCLKHLEDVDKYEDFVDKLVKEGNFINRRLEKAKILFDNLKSKLIL